MTLEQAIARTGCLQCIPASQLWALLVANQGQLVLDPPTCFTLRCVNDVGNTIHEVCCVRSQGQYTLEPRQTAGGSNPVDGIAFTASDSTVHVLQLVFDQGIYTVDVVQSAGGSSPISSLPIHCPTDQTNHTVTIIFDQGWYTYNIV